MKIKPILSGILALALLGACKSATTIVENDLGIIQGNVALSDVLCKPISNGSGTTVQIQGTSFSTTTAGNGQWQINNVPAGIYNILITKPGFDTDLIPEDQFSGAGTQFLENQTIYATPMDSVPILSIEITKKDSIVWLDSNAWLNDTVYFYDTVSYIYFVTFTYTMQGADSAVSFEPELTDITRSANFNGDLQDAITISKNANLVRTDTLIGLLPPNSYNQTTHPRPGDSIVVSTYPMSQCGRGRGLTLSKGFVLP